MKRALGLIFIIAICVAGFLSIRGTLPFMPVFGTSMEPELKAGDLILIEEVSPSEVKVGDIIVFEVPSAVREHYNYPPVIAHRVIKVNKETMTFRTKGDNTGEDPFTVRAQDIRGQVGKQIPYAGFPLLFLQSRQGLIFIIIALCLFALYLYAEELSWGKEKVHRGLFAPVIEESRRSSRVIAQRMEATEKRMADTQQALEKFGQAIEVYAQHLESHTAAIQGLSEASQELKKGAAEQNKVLIRLMEIMEQSRPRVEEVKPKAEEVALKVEKVKFPPGCIRSRQKPAKEDKIFWAE
ncbi:MAG: signal peptidase I [Dehalococcoidales bacterium]|nr:signal peptidase I [Dehalococcoidales bacterium]